MVDWVAPVEAAGPGALSFVDNPRYADRLKTTSATACFCVERFIDRAGPDVSLLVTPRPYEAFARTAAVLYPAAMRPASFLGQSGMIDETATVHPEASIEEGVTVESGARVGAGAAIGRGSVIGPNSVVAVGVQIGRSCVIGPNSSIQHALIGDRVIIHSGCAIGQDGFGYAMGPGGHRKVPQIGRVIIQDDVEIGANCAIDRGANRDTVIGEGTKIDNLVQVGHNARLGRHCVLAGQVGLSGSLTLGDFVVMGGQSGAKGHIDIGNGAQIGGASAVYGDVPPGAQWAGTPAMPVQHWLREIANRRKRADKRGDEGKKR